MVEGNNISITTELQQLISADQAWHYRIVPKSQFNGTYQFYIDNTQAVNDIKPELEVLLDKHIELFDCDTLVVQQALGKYYRKGKGTSQAKTIDFRGVKTDSFLDELLHEAKHLGSSDIHIEAYEDKCRIRIRIDGHLIERYVVEKAEYPALVNKIKIKANLDIAEKRLPQDGRIKFKSGEDKFDVRVSVLPTLHGEKVVLRLLSNDATQIDIRALGFSEEEYRDYIEGIKKPNGIVLISGPTGSGKTTTLYATLKILNEEKSNIVTVEDPIEYTLDGINQVLVRENIGLTFASALKSFLRQDPDVIMLGEIRDGETANMAIRAALTGHLVLSTIHTNSAWGTISRLVDMGVPSYLLASTLNTSVAQRLVRLLCKSCCKEESLDVNRFPKTYHMPHKLEKHHVAVGCDDCYYTGYKGRKAVYEIIPITRELAEVIKSNEFNIDNYIKENNIRTLQHNAFELLAAGETSLDEVYPILAQNH